MATNLQELDPEAFDSVFHAQKKAKFKVHFIFEVGSHPRAIVLMV
jgi:hypothetical protein